MYGTVAQWLAAEIRTMTRQFILKRATAGRRQRVQVYQAWRMTVTFTIRGSDSRAGPGDGLVIAIQNHGIEPADDPLGQPGIELGIGRASRSNLAEGIPESVGVELRVAQAADDAAIEVRACGHGPYSVDNTGDNAKCRQGISFWKPQELCLASQPSTCCSDSELALSNTCFQETVTDGSEHEFIIQYYPYSLSVYLDDPSQPKVQLNWDIRSQIASYVCQGALPRSPESFPFLHIPVPDLRILTHASFFAHAYTHKMSAHKLKYDRSHSVVPVT